MGDVLPYAHEVTANIMICTNTALLAFILKNAVRGNPGLLHGYTLWNWLLMIVLLSPDILESCVMKSHFLMNEGQPQTCIRVNIPHTVEKI